MNDTRTCSRRTGKLGPLLDAVQLLPRHLTLMSRVRLLTLCALSTLASCGPPRPYASATLPTTQEESVHYAVLAYWAINTPRGETLYVDATAPARFASEAEASA